MVFVEVRMPAKHLVLGTLTRGRGSSARGIVESTVHRGERVFRVWAVVEGPAAERLEEAATEIEARYGTRPRLFGDGRLVFDVRQHHVENMLFGSLVALQASFGPPWMGVSGGRVRLRAEGRDCEPRDCVQRLRKALALAEVPARVEAVEPTPDELKAWAALDAWREAQGADLDLLA